MIEFDGSEKIDWKKVGNDEVRIKFVIPVGNPNRKWWQFWKKKNITPKKAQEEISKLISDYKEDINWDDESGTISINGDKKLPYTKEIWFVTDNGTPNIDVIKKNK